MVLHGAHLLWIALAAAEPPKEVGTAQYVATIAQVHAALYGVLHATVDPKVRSDPKTLPALGAQLAPRAQGFQAEYAALQAIVPRDLQLKPISTRILRTYFESGQAIRVLVDGAQRGDPAVVARMVARLHLQIADVRTELAKVRRRAEQVAAELPPPPPAPPPAPPAVAPPPAPPPPTPVAPPQPVAQAAPVKGKGKKGKQVPAPVAAPPTPQTVVAAAPPPPPLKPSLLALELSAQGVEPAVAAEAHDLMVAALREAAPSEPVFSQLDAAMLKRQLEGRPAECARTAECLAGAVGATRMFAGAVRRMEGHYRISLRLIDVASGQVNQLATGDAGDAGSGLAHAVRRATRELLGLPTAPPVSAVSGDAPAIAPAPPPLSPPPPSVAAALPMPPAPPLAPAPARSRPTTPVSAASPRLVDPPGEQPDLAGLQFSAAALMFVQAYMNGFTANTGFPQSGMGMVRLGYRFDNGFLLQGTRTIGMVQLVNPSGLLASETYAGGLGYSFGGRVRFTPSVSAGMSPTYPAGASVSSPRGDVWMTGLASLEVSWAITRYLEVGALASAQYMQSRRHSLMGASVGLSVGLPGRAIGDHAPAVFYKDPAFWITTVLTGAALAVSFAMPPRLGDPNYVPPNGPPGGGGLPGSDTDFGNYEIP